MVGGGRGGGSSGTMPCNLHQRILSLAIPMIDLLLLIGEDHSE